MAWFSLHWREYPGCLQHMDGSHQSSSCASQSQQNVQMHDLLLVTHAHFGKNLILTFSGSPVIMSVVWFFWLSRMFSFFSNKILRYISVVCVNIRGIFSVLKQHLLSLPTHPLYNIHDSPQVHIISPQLLQVSLQEPPRYKLCNCNVPGRQQKAS